MMTMRLCLPHESSMRKFLIVVKLFSYSRNVPSRYALKLEGVVIVKFVLPIKMV
jgi:hypothetical protein